MKYILIFLLALLCSVGYAQFPVNQYMGSQTTLVTSRGGLKADSSLILPQFPDTTTANRSPYIKFYPGNLIRVFNDIYMRNTTATGWILVSGGGGSNNFIDSLKIISDSVYARKYGVFVYQYKTPTTDTTSLSNRINQKIDSLYKIGDSVFARKNGVFVFQYLDISQNILANNGLSFSGDTLQLGGTLTKNTTINADSNEVRIDTTSKFIVTNGLGLNHIYTDSTITRLDVKSSFPGEQNFLKLYLGDIVDSEPLRESKIELLTAADNKFAGIGVNNTGGVSFYAYEGANQSSFGLSKDSITISPNDGILNIDSLKSNTDTIGYYPLKWNATTGKVEAYSSGFASNVLANNGLSKSVDTIQLGGSLIKDTEIIGGQYSTKISAIGSNDYFPVTNYLSVDGNNTELVVEGVGDGYSKVRQRCAGETMYATDILSKSDSGSRAEILVRAGEGTDVGEKAIIQLYASKGGKYTDVRVESDSVYINSPDSIISISQIKTNADTANYLPLMWNPSVKRLEAYRGGFTPTIDTNSLRRVKYVGLTMPTAFNVTGSPITDSGTIAVTGAGTASQYVRGDGTLANFPSNGGGGSSVNYYLNGSVNQGTFGGATYYQLSKVPIIGTGTNFTRTSAQGNGYIASFITDTNDPALLNIPGGNWNLEFYFNASSGGGSPSFYAEIYKVSATNVFTLIASGSTNPEGITQGTVVDQYFTSIPVPQTTLVATDRIAIRIFVTPSGRNITLHTEDNNLSEVLTTFSTGLNALNGLTAQVQYFDEGTSGTDFNISSATDTHTFNLPTASATNRGALSSADWSTFNSKMPAIVQQTYTSGASVTCNNNTTWLIINPASLQSTLTVNLPSVPSPNQDVLISFGGTLTTGVVVNTLTISPTPLQSTTPSFIEVGESVGYRWNATNSKWYRVN